MQDDNQPTTRKDLKEFAQQIIDALRDEMDSKLAAQEVRIKNHIEEAAAAHSTEIMETIASVVEPMQGQVRDHEIRISTLEHKAI